MTKRIDDINDDQIRVLGKHNKPKSLWRRKKKLIITLSILTIIIVWFVSLFTPDPRSSSREAQAHELEKALYEPKPANKIATEPVAKLGDYSNDNEKAYTEHIQKTINDISLDIYIPHNATLELCLGVPNIYDTNIILTTQAADIRADNGKIVGAFVLKGEPLAWGLSKKGYCAIIDGKVTIGVADNSPLFEEATKKGGYFFRQYPLVDNGQLVENELKGKSIRKAICDRAGEIIVVITQSDESMHDFAQALVDLHVDNAIYLVGSKYSYGYFRDKSDHFKQFSQKNRGGQKYENFIVWRF